MHGTRRLRLRGEIQNLCDYVSYMRTIQFNNDIKNNLPIVENKNESSIKRNLQRAVASPSLSAETKTRGYLRITAITKLGD